MLLDTIKAYTLILASNSPRRQELMQAVGFECKLVTNMDVSESYPGDLQGREIALYLAEKKSTGYHHPLGDKDILITADTILYQGGRVLEKPNNSMDARKSLRMISGESHFVFTGVCLRNNQKRKSFVSSTEVKFAQLSDEEINYYIQNYQPYDKAGAYGIQEWIGYVGVEKINGSYFNVMGLPLHQLYRELEKFIKNEN